MPKMQAHFNKLKEKYKNNPQVLTSIASPSPTYSTLRSLLVPLALSPAD